jgi:hypothetical protein
MKEHRLWVAVERLWPVVEMTALKEHRSWVAVGRL